MNNAACIDRLLSLPRAGDIEWFAITDNLTLEKSSERLELVMWSLLLVILSQVLVILSQVLVILNGVKNLVVKASQKRDSSPSSE